LQGVDDARGAIIDGQPLLRYKAATAVAPHGGVCLPSCLACLAAWTKLLIYLSVATPSLHPAPIQCLAAQGIVGEDGQPTELGLGEGVGMSSFMCVGINRLLSQSTE
jgi:hypothetical protein